MRKYCVNYSNKFPMITSEHEEEDVCENWGDCA